MFWKYLTTAASVAVLISKNPNHKHAGTHQRGHMILSSLSGRRN